MEFHMKNQRDSLLKKWGQSDVDPQEFKRIIRSS